MKKTVNHFNCNRKKIKDTKHVGLYLFRNVWLLALKVFRYLSKSYLYSKMGQTRLVSITRKILCKPHSSRVDGSSSNHILHLRCDLHMFYFFIYLVFFVIFWWEDWFNNANWILILHKQHCVCDGQNTFPEKSLLDAICIRPSLIAYIVLIKPFTMDSYSLISYIPISTDRFIQTRDCFVMWRDFFWKK